MVYDEGGGRGTKNVPVRAGLRRQFVLDPEEVRELARQALVIERHYGERAGEPRPMDIEWAKDGRSGQLYIVQARPETAHSHRDRSRIVTYSLRERGRVLVEGRAVGNRIGAGSVMRLESAAEIHRFQAGSVLVTEMTDPDWEPILKMAAAIVASPMGTSRAPVT